ncbi:hypothetical protein GCM10009127_25860 [Alteraurantiacibacter aestuarii]|uniref:OmpP1/FadL family transporter n=1 Tax=Alteraurantiacibacter aestuarii TaxID=650004 RepID=UPI0031DAE731
MKNFPNIASARTLLAASAAALVLTSTPALATDGYFLNGIGAKSKGMGGAAIALPQEALAIASNPAAATELDQRLDIGVEVFIPDRGATIRGNGAGLDGNFSGNGANPFLLPEFAYVRPLSDSVSVGLAINANGGMNTVYETNPFGPFGATGNAGVDLKQVFITPTVAVEFAEGQSLGVSPIAMVQGFRVTGIQPFSAASADPANFTNNGTDWSFGAGFRVGYLGQVTKGIRIGAFYQSKIWASKFDNYAGLFSDHGSFDVPSSYGAGIAIQPTERLTLAADVKRIEYSDVTSVGTPLAPLFANVPFGAVGGPGFGWDDVTVFKLGAAYQVSDTLTVRGGYGRSDNPVPSSETFLNILAPGVVQDHFTLGATLDIGSGKELTAYAMRAPRNDVAGAGSIPAPYGGGEAAVYLAETSFGLAFGWSL